MASHRTFVWPNQIWPDKFTIHYQWKIHLVYKRKQMSGQFLVLIISTVVYSCIAKGIQMLAVLCFCEIVKPIYSNKTIIGIILSNI